MTLWTVQSKRQAVESEFAERPSVNIASSLTDSVLSGFAALSLSSAAAAAEGSLQKSGSNTEPGAVLLTGAGTADVGVRRVGVGESGGWWVNRPVAALACPLSPRT